MATGGPCGGQRNVPRATQCWALEYDAQKSCDLLEILPTILRERERQKEINHKELVPVIMEAEKSQDLEQAGDPVPENWQCSHRVCI